MCLGCRTTVNKLVFYAIVIGLWVGSAAFIGIGIYLAVENPTLNYGSLYRDYDTAVWDAAVYILLIAGACLAGLGFAGFCGARKGSGCLLWIFNVSMLVFIATELALMIMAGVFKGDVSDPNTGLRVSMENQVAHEYVSETSEDSISKDWNAMQKDLKCCGSNYYSDYFLYSNYYNTTGNYVPYTCCEGEQTNFEQCKREASGDVDREQIQYLRRDGCYIQMKILVEDQTSMIVATACIVAGIQLGGFFIGCFLSDNLKKTGKMDS